MKTAQQQPYIYAYLGLALVHLGLLLINSHGVFISLTKQSLMITLFLHYLSQTYKIQYTVIIALIFAFLGDLFLLEIWNEPIFFLLGLGSFLIMQGLYISIFWQLKRGQKGLIENNLIWLLPPIIGLLPLFIVVLPRVSAELIIPIIFYAFSLLLTMLTALNLQNWGLKYAVQKILWGSITFAISDTLIAINKFVMTIPYASFLIMLTYILAQGFIITGILQATSTDSPQKYPN